MSTKTRRSSAAKETVTSGTPEPSRIMSSPMRPQSPLNSTYDSRRREKEELQDLNDRLASFLDGVWEIAGENSRLMLHVQSWEESRTREVCNLKGLYEKEIIDARRLIDELGKEKALAIMETNKLQTETTDLRDRTLRLQKELDLERKQRADAEDQANRLQGRVNVLAGENTRLHSQMSDLQSRVSDVEAQLMSCRKQLETETLLRVELQNEAQTLKEELLFQQQLHEKELLESSMQRRVAVEEVREQYDSRLREELRIVREHLAEEARRLAEEQENATGRRMERLEIELTEARSQLSDELERRRQGDNREEEWRRRAEQERLRAEESESRAKRIETTWSEERAVKDREIRQLRDEMELSIRDYQTLLELKLKLDMEIATYRKLIENSEERLRKGILKRPGATPSRATPKRRRVAIEEEEFSNTATASGPLQITEADPHGKFVRIANSTTDDVVTGGWILRRNTDAGAENTYKFHGKSQLKAGQTVTVWSSDAGATHSPPADIVMKNQKWALGEKTVTVLENSDGNEMARLESVRVMRTSDAPDSSHADNKCSLM